MIRQHNVNFILGWQWMCNELNVIISAVNYLSNMRTQIWLCKRYWADEINLGEASRRMLCCGGGVGLFVSIYFTFITYDAGALAAACWPGRFQIHQVFKRLPVLTQHQDTVIPWDPSCPPCLMRGGFEYVLCIVYFKWKIYTKWKIRPEIELPCLTDRTWTGTLCIEQVQLPGDNRACSEV